jgi:hypothetical protein
MRRTASVEEISRSSGTSTKGPRRFSIGSWSGANFALCVDTGGNVDLDLRKLYRIRVDKRSLSQGFVRIYDESGEDYLYPLSFFLPVRLPHSAVRLFRRLASSRVSSDR